MIELFGFGSRFFGVEHVHQDHDAETLDFSQSIFIPIQSLLRREFLELDVRLRLLPRNELVALLLELCLLHGELEPWSDLALVQKLYSQRHRLYLHVTHQTIAFGLPALIFVHLDLRLATGQFDDETSLLEVIVNFLEARVRRKPLDVHVWRVLELLPLLRLLLLPFTLLTRLFIFPFLRVLLRSGGRSTRGRSACAAAGERQLLLLLLDFHPSFLGEHGREGEGGELGEGVDCRPLLHTILPH
mmetsp:Transcript_33387/g.64544  ORF Transcript_33387/g.64544 Transcript_33387/m.64544 type:complete len:244 (+) Transcript_33387:524-1255(+)